MTRYDPKRLLTRKQVAALAGVSLDTVDGWIAKGALKPCCWTPGRRPRFAPEDVFKSEKPAKGVTA